MKSLAVLLFSILFLSLISAICSENQIDINSASSEELQKIKYIGEVKAQAIIDSRPFESVDDLINVYGIGEKTLEMIKAQEIACVGEEVEDTGSETEEGEIEKEYVSYDVKKTELPEDKKVKSSPEIIKLKPQTIKSEDDTKVSENNYTLYGLIAFSVLIVALLGLRFAKEIKYKKNEFD